MTHDPWLSQLDAYLDGELDSGAMQKLDLHLRECSACTAESLRRLQWKRTVHSAGQRYRPDAALRERVLKSVASRSSRRFSLRWVAMAAVAAVLVAALGMGILWRQRQSARQDQVMSELADLHISTLASASPVDVVSTDRHTVKPWFEGKIPFSFNLPELQGTGFELVGGRVSYLEQSPGAELIYRIRKHQISVFIFQERVSALPADESTEARSFHLESWTRGGLRYFVIGDAAAEDLRALKALLTNAG